MMLHRRRVRAVDRLPDEQLSTAWQLCSLLIGYPEQTLLERLPLVRAATATLPDQLAEPLTRITEHLSRLPLGQAQRDYVETFDHTRRHCLHLTYFTCGDTRRRGVALVQLKQAYRRAGVELTAEELPDHLAVVLEFGASADLDVAWQILTGYRASLEMLRIALQDSASPWADVVTAVSRTLPPLAGDERAAIARLIADGPPAEDVGAELSSLDPRINPLPDYLAAGATR